MCQQLPILKWYDWTLIDGASCVKVRAACDLSTVVLGQSRHLHVLVDGLIIVGLDDLADDRRHISVVISVCHAVRSSFNAGPPLSSRTFISDATASNRKSMWARNVPNCEITEPEKVAIKRITIFFSRATPPLARRPAARFLPRAHIFTCPPRLRGRAAWARRWRARAWVGVAGWSRRRCARGPCQRT